MNYPNRRRYVDFGSIGDFASAVNPVRIKICGISSPAMAQVACAAGAHAIGLMFYQPSPRHLSIEAALPVREAIDPFSVAVAVMVNPERSYVQEIIDRVRVDRLQFHGEESDSFCASFGLPYIKVLRISDDSAPAQLVADYPASAAVLLDTHVPGLYGGAGKRFDWNKARFTADRPIILAGGLTPDNVGEAIRVAAPAAVDVSSGVETDGAKDAAKIRAFCDSVRAANR